MHKPIATAALSLAVGILLGNGFRYVPCAVAVFFLAAAAASLLLFRRHPRNGRTAALALGGMLCGGILLVSSAALPHDHYLRLAIPEGPVREAAGRIVSPLERDPGRTAFLLDLERLGDRKARGTIRVVLKEDQTHLGYGDRVLLAGKIYPVRGYRNPGGFDYPAYLAHQGVYALLSVDKRSAPRVLERGTGLFRTFQDWRERIRQAFLAQTHGPASAVLQAMILGEEGGLTTDLRETFLAAGVTHILSISGSHLGLVAVITFWLVRNLLFLLPERHYHRMTLVVDPRKITALLAAVPVFLYALLAGGQQATVRSLIMLLVGVAALLADREHDLVQALALAALTTLVPDPQALFDISFQLSYLSVAAILFVVSTSRESLPPARSRRGRILRDLLLLLAISAAATLATAPLVAYYFNRLSLWSLVSNMIIVPFAGFAVVPLGLLSGLLSLFRGTLPVAGLVQSVGDAFMAVTSFFASLPGATVAFPAPGPIVGCAYAGLIASFAALLRRSLLARSHPFAHSSRLPRPALAVAASAGFLLIAVALLPHFSDLQPRVTFLDVGQGDCALVETSGGRSILIDGGGTAANRFDTGQRVVAPFLWNRGIGAVDLMILSHPHPDHMNGLTSVLRLFSVREIWASGRDRELEGYEEFRKTAEARGVPIRTVHRGDGATLDGATVDVLHPGPAGQIAGRRAYERENNRSLVVRVTMNGRRFLFPGDIQQETERGLVEAGSDLRSDLLKVPHHGSKTSSTASLLSAVGPSTAVVSVSAGNPYRQPSDEVVSRYAAGGIALFRTDRDGAIIVKPRRDRLETIAWAPLLLKPVTDLPVSAWGKAEGSNWKRLWIRQGEI